jgi:hypothetical protein
MCTLSFLGRTFEGADHSKSAAEKTAARDAADYLIETDRRTMPLLIANKITVGLHRSDKGVDSVEASPAKLLPLRKLTLTSCSDAAISKSLTLKADALPYSLNHTATNEDLAFCGSWLAQAFEGDESLNQARGQLSLRPPVLACIKKARRRIFPRTKELLSDAFYADIVQALLYSEFLIGGYEAAKRIFDKCMLISRTQAVSGTFGPFPKEHAIHSSPAGVYANNGN